MRLLVLSNLYPPNVIGGYERLCFDVTSMLTQHGHQVTVLTSTFGDKAEEFPGQVVERSLQLLIGDSIYIPFGGGQDERDTINRNNIATLHNAIRQTQPEAILAWNLFFLDRSMLDALTDIGIRVVLMLTDNWLITIQNPLFMTTFFRDNVFGSRVLEPAHVRRGRLRARAALWLQALAGRNAQLSRPTEPVTRLPFEAIFGSRFIRDLYAASGIEFVQHRVIHNGVRQAHYPAAGPYRDRTRLIEPQELRLLFAGRIVDLKGLHTAIDALPLLNAAELGLQHIRLTIVGDTQDAIYFQSVRERIERTGCAAQIVMQEPVAESALLGLFQSHDIYLFPSLYEPFSLTLIHAMACRIPTIASRAGGNVEIVQDHETGILFETGNPQDLARAVRLLATQPALRERIAVNGQKITQSFTLERMTAEMEQYIVQPPGSA